MGTFSWTKKRERAAALVAEGLLTDAQIAEHLDLSRNGLGNWKRQPAFQARVQEHVTAQRDALTAEGIANRQNRVAALTDRWERLRAVIQARAEDETLSDPAASTGLLVRTYKALGSGEAARLVEEYAVDTGLLKELREHEKQAAQELGQWAEKHELTGKDGEPFTFRFDGLPEGPRDASAR